MASDLGGMNVSVSSVPQWGGGYEYHHLTYFLFGTGATIIPTTITKKTTAIPVKVVPTALPRESIQRYFKHAK